jgi:spermidine synthase
MIDLAKHHPVMTSLNRNALDTVEIINQDAYIYLMNNTQRYDIIIADFPDPRDISLAKLYSKEIYMNIARSLTDD